MSSPGRLCARAGRAGVWEDSKHVTFEPQTINKHISTKKNRPRAESENRFSILCRGGRPAFFFFQTQVKGAEGFKLGGLKQPFLV